MRTLSSITPRILAVTAALLLGACSCSKTGRPVVDSLEIDAFEGGEVVAMTETQLKDRLSAALSDAKFTVLKPGADAPDGPAPWHLRLAAGLEEPNVEDVAGSRVAVVLQLRQKGQNDGFEVRADEQAVPPTHDVQAVEGAVRSSLERTLRRAVREAHAVIELSDAKDEVVSAKLADADEATRAGAIRVLVARKNLSAVPALLEELKSPDLRKMRAAVGLLVELKAQQAVNPIIEASRQRGPTVEREVVFAISAIGGEDAEAYLDLVAEGSDDPSLRSAAERALRELRRAREVRAAHQNLEKPK